jgi:glycosyltransferase involved in cell wall biosynthesis
MPSLSFPGLGEMREPKLALRLASVPHRVLGDVQGRVKTRPEKPPVFLFFGRIEFYKGLGFALEAEELLASRGLTFRLLIAGVGSALDLYRPKIREMPWVQLMDRRIHADEIPRERERVCVFMRLVFLLNSLVPGGAELHTLQLANALATSGDVCTVVSLARSGSTAHLSKNPVKMFNGNRIYDIGTLLSVTRLIRADRPQLIVAIEERPLLFATISRQLAGSNAKLGFAPDDYVIGICAQFRPEKNHCQLIDAVRVLRNRGYAVKALLVGGGPTQATVARYARESGLLEHIVFAGHQQDVRPYTSAFDVGVLCSLYEAAPLAALEMMAMGLPVVVSNVGGAAEIVRDGENGFLFPAGDTMSLVSSIEMTRDPLEREALGRAASKFIAAHFSVDRMLESYRAFLSELLLGQRRCDI